MQLQYIYIKPNVVTMKVENKREMNTLVHNNRYTHIRKSLVSARLGEGSFMHVTTKSDTLGIHNLHLKYQYIEQWF